MGFGRSYGWCRVRIAELGESLCAGACLPSNKRPRQCDLNQAPQLNDVFPVWLEASPQERWVPPNLPS